MTDEQTAQAQEAAWEAAPYIQFSMPSVPYSAIRIPLSNDPKQSAAWIDLAMRAGKYMAKQYAEAFPQAAATTQPQATARVPQRAQATGTGVYCPEHHVECRKTDAKYDKDGDRWYHPQDGIPDLPDGRHVKNHNLYWRETVDKDGETNQGKVMPAPSRRPALAGARRQGSDGYEDDPDPGYDDSEPSDMPF